MHSQSNSLAARRSGGYVEAWQIPWYSAQLATAQDGKATPGLEAAAPLGSVPPYVEAQPTACPIGRRLELQQHAILRALYEEFRVTSAKADRAQEAERLAKQRFEDALPSQE